MMMLAALYDDEETFFRLSLTVEKGSELGEQQGLPPNLFPWIWDQNSIGSTEFTYTQGTLDNASDGAINIALAYIYANEAGFEHPYNNYKTLAYDRITAIREYLIDSNLSLLGDGYNNGLGSFHPDYYTRS